MILFVVDPVNELINEYSKVFGSGLVLPETNTIKKAKPTPPSGNNAFVKL